MEYLEMSFSFGVALDNQGGCPRAWLSGTVGADPRTTSRVGGSLGDPADRSHAFAIEAFRVNLIPNGGETVTVEFIADQAGTFAFTCSEYCGAGHSRMKGKLVVLVKGK